LKKTIFSFLFLTSSSLLTAGINDLQTFESNFKQTIINDQNSHITYAGKLYAKKDKNQALWIYTNPIDKKIYYSKGRVVIIEPELEQAIFAKLDKIPNILSLLKQAKKISNDTYITTFNNTQYKILVNKNQITKISYTDELHNRVNIEFKNQKSNQNISDSKFAYHIPSDYDILEQK